jgi:hypothetical protein
MRLVIASLTFLFFALAFSAFAADDHAQEGCSNATLSGSYGFYRTGFTPDGPLSAVGIVFYDGNGHSKVRQRISRNGHIQHVTSSYEYKVAPDCTTKTFLDGEEIANGVISNNGNKVFFVGVTEGNTIYGVVEKIHSN